MSVFADEPRWPRHGTLWGHLISDESLDELHAAADAAGLPPRAFDLDHYDWPVDARADLERIGVRFVSSGELTRRLLASGLRIRAADRPRARRYRAVQGAQALGLESVPTDLVVGRRGHVEPLPAMPGAFRLTRDTPSGDVVVQAADAAGEQSAQAWITRVDAGLTRRGREPFVGQALVLPIGRV